MGVWGISASKFVSEERSRQLYVLHLEVSSGYENAGFQLGALGPVEILVPSKAC